MDFRDARRFLNASKDCLISTHINADGDAIGSALAMARILNMAGKACRIVVHDRKVDPKYSFLAGFDEIEPYNPSAHRRPASHIVLVDSPTAARVGDVTALIGEKADILNIDHHPSNVRFGQVNLVDEDACSTSEIIFFLAKSLKLRVDQDLATQLYTGVVFDTGRFRYSNLQRAFPVAASLLKSGVDPVRIAEAIYGQKSYPSVKVLGQALSSLETHLRDRVAIMCLPHSAIRLATDLDGIVDYAISIAGVEVAVLLKEQKPRQFRVSFRSRGTFDVNDLAHDFRGGGHPNAAGCCIDGDETSVKEVLLKAIRRRLKRLERD